MLLSAPFPCCCSGLQWTLMLVGHWLHCQQWGSAVTSLSLSSTASADIMETEDEAGISWRAVDRSAVSCPPLWWGMSPSSVPPGTWSPVSTMLGAVSNLLFVMISKPKTQTLLVLECCTILMGVAVLWDWENMCNVMLKDVDSWERVKDDVVRSKQSWPS